MTCPSCGTQNHDGARFCNDCGAAQRPSPEDSECPTPAGAAHGSGSRPNDARGDPLVGRTLDGKYRLDMKLGRGGMGSVYAATRTRIGDAVAVKVLHLKESADPHSAERFRREALAAARLKHPNAVGIYDFGVTADGLHYLVMELVEGQSLRSVIRQQGPLSSSTALEVMTQVCAALDEAHRQNIVHRDVKPDNIIVSAAANGLRVKVLDFGVAKLCDLAGSNLTQPDSIIGTPRYMSPEQCDGDEVDGRSDIYSLGVVLYEMLCGVVPFNAPSSKAIRAQHVRQPPPRPRTKNVNITPAVEAVMLHALEKRPEERPQTAGALAQELNDAVNGRASVEPPRPTHNAPTTSRDASFAPGAASALFTPTPEPGNRYAATAGEPQYDIGPASQPRPKRRLSPLVLGSALLLVIAGGTIGVMAWWPRNRAADGGQTRPASDERQAVGAAGAAVPQQEPTITSAESELNRLKVRLSHAATLADHREILGALFDAETKYPADYRFPYERAKLEVEDKEGHDSKVATPLFLAAQVAIDHGRAGEMLNDLRNQEDGEFRGFSRDPAHRADWQTLLEALDEKDKSKLRHADRGRGAAAGSTAVRPAP